MKTKTILITLLAVCLVAAHCWAAETSTSDMDPTCPDNELLTSNLVTDISWSTLFPIRIAGVPVGGGDVPDGAAPARPLCACPDNNGVPEVGTQIGMFEPARVVDVTRSAGCLMSIGGVRAPMAKRSIGMIGSDENDGSDRAFYHYTYYAFPLLVMMDLFLDPGCNKDGYMDMDLMYTSPVDPTWNDDELAFFLNAEAAWAGTPVAQAAQIPDCLAASAGDSIEKFFWTAGCWGNLYPFTGNIDHEGSPPRDSNLIATRAVAALHRRGLARKTMGDDAMCKGDIYPMIPKSQYKWSMLYPIPEVKGDENLAPGDASASGRDVAVKGSHVTGESTFLWGEWRNIPAVGEDFTYLLWRWNDCCMR